MLALALILYRVISLYVDAPTESIAMNIQAGQLDLSEVALNDVEPISLSGEWQFVWRSLIPPDEPFDADAYDVARIPHEWFGAKIDKEQYSQYGYASYRLNVTTTQQYPLLALKLPNLGTAYELYIDDVLLAQGGTVSTMAEQARPEYTPGIYLFEPASDSFVITIHVSNYHLMWGGVWAQPSLGTAESVYKDYSRQSVQTVALVSFLITAALFNAIQYFLRATDPSPLIIAFICLLMALREVETTNLLYFMSFASWSFETAVRLNFLTFFGITPFVIGYFYLNFREYYHRTFIITFCAVSAVIITALFLTPPSVFSLMMPTYQVIVLLLAVYTVIGLIRAAYNNEPHAGILTMGTLFLFVLIVNDILANVNIIESIPLVGYGLAAFIMCQTYITYMRFVSESSEKLVYEELAAKDPLTGLYNRRGIRQHMQTALDEFERLESPFCVMLIDFDHFKKINDELGHDVGDKVLIEGAKVMQKTVRDQDIVARWGGEEFLLLTPRNTLMGATNVADKISKNMSEVLGELIGRRLTVTIGVAQIKTGETIDACLKRADLALYHGKNRGRNVVMLSNDD
jgi:diguanylate cyclase (GGDEF)-like protein